LFAIPCAWICGLEVVVEGREHFTAHQPCVFVGNHQSGYDMVVFGHVFPGGTVVVGKKQLLWIPFFGLFFKAAGNILLNREKRVSALAGLSAAVKEIRARKLSVLIFPEGTRNTGEADLLPFKKGAFYMAIQAGVPVVPFVGSRLAPMVNWSERRMLPGRVWVRALPPVPTQGLSEKGVEELAQRVRAMMIEAMRTLPPAEPRRTRARAAALGLAFASVALLSGCSSAAKREQQGTHHQISHLIPYTLKVRRPVGAGANPVAGPGGEDYASRPLPDARLDCQSLDALFAELNLDEVRACFASLNIRGYDRDAR
jgi:1-acyl-sn-glycerol-3-phosphate acyltransferase